MPAAQSACVLPIFSCSKNWVAISIQADSHRRCARICVTQLAASPFLVSEAEFMADCPPNVTSGTV